MLAAVAAAEHPEPHAVLGPHPYEGGVTVRGLRPLATAVAALANQSGTFVIYVLVPLLSPGTTRADVLRMDVALAAASAVTAAAFLAHCPAHPLVPPSRSAARAAAAESAVTPASLLASRSTNSLAL